MFVVDKVVAANYSNNYAKTFGEFTADTSSVLLKNVEENSVDES